MKKSLEDWNQLDCEHKKFVLRVHASNGCKYGAAPCSSFSKEIDEPGISFWSECERLGFIECVGSYKWISTDKYNSLINALLGIK